MEETGTELDKEDGGGAEAFEAGEAARSRRRARGSRRGRGLAQPREIEEDQAEEDRDEHKDEIGACTEEDGDVEPADIRGRRREIEEGKGR